jgi:hypothetical protein
VRWSAITVGGARAEPQLAAERGSRRNPEAPSNRRPLTSAAVAALDRIDIPEEVRQRISEGMREGASLIVSDEALSNETGKGTEFVILTRD